MIHIKKFNENIENQAYNRLPEKITKKLDKYLSDKSEVTDAYLVDGTNNLYIIHTSRDVYKKNFNLLYLDGYLNIINPLFKFNNKEEFLKFEEKLLDLIDIFIDYNSYFSVYDQIEKLNKTTNPKVRENLYYQILLNRSISEYNIESPDIYFTYTFEKNDLEEATNSVITSMNRINDINYWKINSYKIEFIEYTNNINIKFNFKVK
jgi:hypothetical protein